MNQEIIEAWGEKDMPPRWAVFEEAIRRKLHTGLRILETGTMINTANGGSTLFWGTHPSVDEVHTIDVNTAGWWKLADHPKIPLKGIHFYHEPTLVGIACQPNKYFDILYLDSDADHTLTLHEYLAALPKLNLPAIVLADDYETKCKLLTQLIDGHVIPHTWRDYGGFKASSHIRNKSVFGPVNTCGMLMFEVTERPTFESVR
jgi:hypothetical protein